MVESDAKHAGKYKIRRKRLWGGGGGMGKRKEVPSFSASYLKQSVVKKIGQTRGMVLNSFTEEKWFWFTLVWLT